VQKALEGVPGVESATVDFDAKTAAVRVKGVEGRTLVAAVNAVDGGGRFTASLK
jgi:copper chaperone CopZ